MESNINPLVSIIVPVYNVEKYLHECLNSILNWDFTNWEAILVDDGSLDNSGAICDEYANKDMRFKVIHKHNEGVSVARNVGLDIALGEWCWFVDSDDVIDSNLFVDRLILKDRDIVMFNIQSYNDGDILPFQNGDSSIEECIDLNSFYINHISYLHQSLWFHKKFWTKDGKYVIRFTRGIRLGEDLEFMRKCEFLSSNPIKMNYTSYYYRQHQGSITHSVEKDKIIIYDTIRIMNNMYAFIDNHRIVFDKWRLLRIATIVKLVPIFAVKSDSWTDKVIDELKNIVFKFKLLGYDLRKDRTILLASKMPRLYKIFARLKYGL